MAVTLDEADLSGSNLTRDEASRLLAQPLPDAPDARYAALQRQYQAALLLEERTRLIATARQLVDAGRGPARWRELGHHLSEC